jgi:hypothetical protein
MPIRLPARLSWISLLILFATGCVTDTAKMKSFVGKSQQEVYQSWGLPDEKRPDAKGGEMWIYRSSDAIAQDRNVYSGVAPSGSWTKTRIFYFDKEGVVYSWYWKGL